MEFNLTHIMGAYKLKYNIIGYLENVYLVSNMFLHSISPKRSMYHLCQGFHRII